MTVKAEQTPARLAPARLTLARLAGDRRGAVAILVAIAIPVFVATFVLAIDIVNFRVIKTRLQAAADAGAIAAVGKLDTPAQVSAEAVRLALANVPAGYGDVTINSDVTIGRFSNAGGFLAGSADANAVRVRAVRSAARDNAARWLGFNIWGLNDVDLSAEAIAARQLNIQYEPPESVNLDNEASDFNELYAYCYDRTAGGTRESRRTQMTLISNNVGADVNLAELSGGYITASPAATPGWPTCDRNGQAVSLRLRNIRSGKAGEYYYQNSVRQEYDYFTDTVIQNGVEQFTGLDYLILETLRCDTLAACKPANRGGQIPVGTNRTPMTEDQPCLPGKYMYFGWEDRPPGLGWTDQDYNDITLVMKCPREGALGDGLTRLVR